MRAFGAEEPMPMRAGDGGARERVQPIEARVSALERAGGGVGGAEETRRRHLG